MVRGEGRKNARPGTFGTVTELPSGRHRALYYGPDGRRYKAPTTFSTKQDARSWLSLQQADIIRKKWEPAEAAQPKPKRITFAEYAEYWLADRTLKDRTREHYRRLLDTQVLPALGVYPLASITPDDVRDWYAKLDAATPTLRSHAYGLVRTIMATAASEAKITSNPCHIRGAGTSKRVHKTKPASLRELEDLTSAMPANYRSMILLASWCALRFGELTELRRKDIEITTEGEGEKRVRLGVIRIRRAVVRVDGEFRVTTPKSDAGVRDVAIPPHLVVGIEAHLAKHVGPQKDDLLFPAQHGGHLAPATLYRQFYKARSAAGRDDLRFHDLRHTGAVLAAVSGATLSELMGRLGHSTPQAAMRYQHTAAGRDRVIAQALSSLAEAAP